MHDPVKNARKPLIRQKKGSVSLSEGSVESLTKLKEETNNVMASVLAEILKLKQEAQTTQEASRLITQDVSPEEIKKQLEELSLNLNLLHRWCLSGTKQIESALQTLEDSTPLNKPIKSAWRHKILRLLKS